MLYAFIMEGTAYAAFLAGILSVRFCIPALVLTRLVKGELLSMLADEYNNMIKTLRRTAYGYPDDDYFFLKIMDASRKSYTRNPKSHKFGD